MSGGNRLVYLDYNATTPLSDSVKAVITGALDVWGNPSSSHELGQKAKELLEKSRGQVAKMIGARNPSDILFNSGGTEGNNHVIQSAIHNFSISNIDITLKPHFISSTIEHDATLKTLTALQRQQLCDVTLISPNPSTGSVEAEQILSAVRRNTVLISLMLANNETGVLQPVSDVVKAIRSKPDVYGHVKVHTDAAQVIGKLDVTVGDMCGSCRGGHHCGLDVDYLTIVGHKFYGPRIGALYVRNLERPDGAVLHPIFYGGGQERSFRPGTENIPMIAGLGAAADQVVSRIKLGKGSEELAAVRDHLETQLKLRGRLPGFNAPTAKTSLDLFVWLDKSGSSFGSGDRSVLGRGEVHCEVPVHINFPDSQRLPNTCSVAFPKLSGNGRDLLDACSALFLASTGAACHSNSNAAKGSSILMKSGVHPELAARTLRISVGYGTTLSEIDSVVQSIAHAAKILS